MNQTLKGSLFCILGGICWGLSGCAGQYLFTYEGMDSRWLVPVRLCCAGILMFLYCLPKYGKGIFEIWKDRNDRRELLVYAILGISLCQFTYFLTIEESSATAATVLQNSSPVMIMIWMCIKKKRLPYPYEVLAVVLALSGLFCITTHGDPSDMAVPLKAVVIGLLSAACVMVYSCVPENILKKYPTAVLQLWAFVTGGALFLLLFRFWQFRYVPTLKGLLGIFVVTVVGSIVGFLFYLNGVRRIGPQKAILYAFSEPVTAYLIGLLAFGGVFSLWDGVGLLLEFIMLAVISVHKEA